MGRRRAWKHEGAINTVTNRRTSGTRIQHLPVSLYPSRSTNSILLSHHGAMISVALRATKAGLFPVRLEHTGSGTGWLGLMVNLALLEKRQLFEEERFSAARELWERVARE